MKAETKLAMRRFVIRQLRYLLDWLDDRLHAAEIRLREELSNIPTRQTATGNKGGDSRIARIVGAPPRDLTHREPFVKERPPAPMPAQELSDRPAAPANCFAQWEARRAGVLRTSAAARPKCRRGTSALQFDQRALGSRRFA